jgi:hypothetical protein
MLLSRAPSFGTIQRHICQHSHMSNFPPLKLKLLEYLFDLDATLDITDTTSSRRTHRDDQCTRYHLQTHTANMSRHHP